MVKEMSSGPSFQQQYGLKILDGMPDKSENYVPYYYPKPSANGREETFKFLVKPQYAKPWVGVVSSGPYVSCHESTGFYPCPNPRLICIVSGGQAFIIDSEIPANWSAVPCTPVLDVKALLNHQILLFIDFARITALGPEGIIWTTRPLAFKGLKITNADQDTIYGTTLDLNGPVPLVPFEIDARTGRSTGGCWLFDTLVPTSEASKLLLSSWFDPATKR
jgi:hypothetical protein